MLGWVGGLRTTSSTTSRGDFWALRASTPTFRQWRNAASRGRRRSAASESGISPAPPCRAMAHPIILSLWKTESQRELSGTGLRSQCWKYVYVERRRKWGDKGYCCKFQRWLRKRFMVAVNVPGSRNLFCCLQIQVYLVKWCFNKQIKVPPPLSQKNDILSNPMCNSLYKVQTREIILIRIEKC